MEILVVVGTLTGRGGIETCVRSLAEEARINGDTVRVLALCASTVDGSWHQGLAYSEVENGSTSLKRQVIRGLPALVRACREHRPDAVVVIYGSTVALARLALALAGLRRPVMAWLHFSSMVKQRTRLLRLAHGHICISREIAQETAALDGVRAESVHLVHNGTRMDSIEPVARSQDGPLRMVHVGRLMVGEQKRTDDLLRSLAGVRGDWRLQLIGTFPVDGDRQRLQALAEELGIASRLEWSGWQADPWGTLEQADLLVLCSAFEGFPLVLIEAMARGIPCVSSDCSSGPSDIIRPGRNGWLYPPGDNAALTARLQLLVDDRALLPPPATVHASVERFSSPRVFQRIRKAIEHTIEHRLGLSLSAGA
ncbi:glycosyltransferase [Variovorax saccharolyticus]|uniref:glycosyltransferase n=1 Tax=Variovorax saccharolyticus TaxID=3053516 RepID=UPI002576E3B4|nr:glycosyltransferase [Variovorax sp. J22R187]MDM0016708.1 glycosyltransferase [Variovorax sp. J22R187]